MLNRVFALTVAVALGSMMLGCRPAEEGGGGGGTMERREPSGTMASPTPRGTMASPTPHSGTGGGGGMGGTR